MPHNVAQSTQIRRFTHVYSLHYIMLIYTRKFGQEEEKERKKRQYGNSDTNDDDEPKCPNHISWHVTLLRILRSI